MTSWCFPVEAGVSCHKDKGKDHKRSAGCRCAEKQAFGDFIRTFTFGQDLVQLPIVQPGGALPIPIAVTDPVRVTAVDEKDRVGLLVPGGTYLVRWLLNPGLNADVTLLVNGQQPVTVTPPAFPYTRQIKTAGGAMEVQYLIKAPRACENLLSLVNSGSTLFTLNDIPNTRQGDIAVITQVTVQRVGD